MIGALKGGNLALAFLLELVALVAFAFWGWTMGANDATRLLLMIALPVVAALLWGAFLSPKPEFQLPRAAVAFAQVAFFALAVFALWGSGHPGAALATAAVLVLNRGLLAVWEP
ncbi:MAG TPA: YrdB family protein [Frankiaceae bacterium]|nr:YrdB family protein [Frankiaceae bacterium]